MFGSDKRNSDEIGKLWKRLSALESVSEKTLTKLEDIEEKIIQPTDSQKTALSAARSAAQHNSKIKKIKDEVIESGKEISGLKNELTKYLDSLDRASTKAQEITVEAATVMSEVNGVVESVNEKNRGLDSSLEQINSLLFENDNLGSEIERIKELIDTSESSSTKVQNLLKSVASVHSKVLEIRDEVFGYEVEDEDDPEKSIKISGLKDKLEESYTSLESNLNDFQNKQATLSEETEIEYNKILENSQEKLDLFIKGCKETFDDTHKEIRKLLPEALTAGLSAAYDKKIEAEESSLDKYQVSFNKAILSLVLISLVPFAIDIYLLIGLGKDLVSVISDTPKLLISILPLYFPVLWIAYSSNKKLNLSKRLIEEYTHKGVLSKTYEGLSNQIEEIGEDSISNDLKIKLLYNLLYVNSENPGKLISDYNTTDHPLMDALDKSVKYADAVEKLRKIPGFTAMANKLEKEGKEKIKQADDKVTSIVKSQVGEENVERQDTA
ncbi:hypothetical protein [Thalassotalea montiporae]